MHAARVGLVVVTIAALFVTPTALSVTPAALSVTPAALFVTSAALFVTPAEAGAQGSLLRLFALARLLEALDSRLRGNDEGWSDQPPRE